MLNVEKRATDARTGGETEIRECDLFKQDIALKNVHGPQSSRQFPRVSLCIQWPIHSVQNRVKLCLCGTTRTVLIVGLTHEFIFVASFIYNECLGA